MEECVWLSKIKEKEKNRVYSPRVRWECVDFLSEHLLGTHYMESTMLDYAHSVQQWAGVMLLGQASI